MNIRLNLLAAFFLQQVSSLFTQTTNTSEKNRFHLSSVRAFLGAVVLVVGWSGSSFGQTPVPMSSQPGLSYTENFNSIAGWTDNFASGTGANRWGSYPITAGSGNDGKRTTKSSATFSTTTGGGVQKGTNNLVFLSTGSSATSEAVAVDFLLDFTGVNAGTLSFNWGAIDNGSGTRPTSLRLYWSIDNTTFTEISAAQVVDVQSPTTGSITTVALPTAFNNTSTARLRFYNHAGSLTGGGNRDKISIDDVTVTAVSMAPTYTVTYNGNSQTTGSAPTDATAYASGATATVIGNTGALTKTGFTFSGWNAATDGSGIDYAVGSTFAIAVNTTLYAKWIATTTPTISTTGSLSALSTTYGTASSNATFSVSGAALTNDITINAPSGFEISISAGSGFGSSITLTQSGGVVASTPIFVRLAATTPFGTYTGNVSLTSSGATPVDVATASSNVNKKALTISSLSGADKIYDGTTSVTVSGTPAYVGLQNSEAFAVSGSSTWAFPNANIGTNKTLTQTGTYNAPSTNYTVTQPVLTASITAKVLTVSGATGNDKVFDNTTAATYTGTLSGVVSPDVVTLNGTGTFASPNVGTGIAITSTATLGGAGAGNYTLTQPVGITANITQASQTITFGALPDKVVGAANFNLTATASSGLTVTYTSSNPAVATVSGNTVTIVGVGTTVITASQAGNGNYTAASNVTQNQLVITGPCFSMNGPSFTTTGSTTAGDADAGGTPTTTIRLASGSSGGSISTTATGVTAGDAVVKFRAKGWSGTETSVTVTLDGISQNVTTLPTAFDEITLNFTSVSANPVLTFSTVTNKRVHIGNVKIFCAPAGSEINLKGNSTSIVNADVTPSATDHTDFGSTAVSGGTVTRTFTIENTGAADLNVSSVSSSNPTEFTVGGITLPATISASGFTTFTVTFDPSALGNRTSTITIGNDDSNENPYTFAIQGTGVNSNTSDIIATAGFSYTSNIDYTLFQGNPVSSTTNGLASFGFTIRDGAGASDADALGTEMTSIAFNVANIANIRSVALFDGSTFIANGIIGASDISFTGLSGSSVTAPDNSTKSLTLYVSFKTNVTDNAQLQYTVISASANVGGSAFAAANGGGAISSISGDNNRLEVTATNIIYGTNPATTSINTLLSAFTLRFVDANDNLDFDNNRTVTLTASNGGVNMVAAASYAINAPHSGIITVSDVKFTSGPQTNISITATTSGLSLSNNIVSTLFNITSLTFVNGDYRSTGTGNWVTNSASPAIWEKYNGSTWVASNSPAYGTTNNVYIQAGHTITATGSFGSSVNIKIQNNGEFVVTSSSTAASIYVYEGGILTVSGSLTVNGTFDVENNAIVNLGFPFGNPTTSIWKGTENFRPESILLISDWDDGVPLYNGDVSANAHNGYTAVFGDVYIDLSAGSMVGAWNLLGSSTGTVNLTHGNFEFDSPNGFDVRFFGTTSFTVNATIHGDLKLNSGWSSARRVVLGTAGTTNIVIDGNLVIDCPGDFAVRSANNVSSPVNLTVNGDIIMNGSNTTAATEFVMNGNVYTTPNGTKSIVNLKGDLLVGSNPKIVNKAPYDDVVFNFNGTTTQLVDVASVVANSDKGIPFFIKNGAYVQLSNNNFVINSGSTVDVEAGGTLDFAWASNGTTPLAILDNGIGTNTFTSRASSVLKITSPDGITSLPGTLGNVRVSGGRTYESLGDFHYIGKLNQNDGNGLPMEIRNLVINNTGSVGNNFVTLTTTPTKNVHNTLTMTIGNVYSTSSNLLVLGASTSELGTLSYVSGYVIGKMRRWFNSTNTGIPTGLFPMGFDDSGLKNRFAKIEYNTGASAGGHLTVEYIGSPMGLSGIPILAANSFGAGFDVVSTENQGYWKIDNQTATLLDGSYTITCHGQGYTTINNLSQLTLLKRVVANGPNWFCIGAHIAPTTGLLGEPVVARSNMSGWSNFGFGGGVANPLPVELLSFSANCENGNVLANWSTASEKNSDYFILQSSDNLENWSEVAEVAGAGNSSQQINYSATDFNSTRGVSYYRLVQFDYDGNTEFFSPISVNCADEGSEFVKVYPNPSTGDFAVEWNMASLTGTVQVTLTSSTGALISERTVQVSNGKHVVPFSETLENGVYYLSVRSEHGSETLKLVIQ